MSKDAPRWTKRLGIKAAVGALAAATLLLTAACSTGSGTGWMNI